VWWVNMVVVLMVQWWVNVLVVQWCGDVVVQ
jgi:hypothetical protein